MGEIADDLTRRGLLARAGSLGLGAVIASAVPLVRGVALPDSALAEPNVADATLQAYFDTIIPGRVVATTALGNAIDPRVIAGVDDRPGAVEADSLALAHHPAIGFDALSPGFLVDLEARAARQGGDFLALGFPARVSVCMSGLDFANPLRLVWEAAAAVPFTAFCAAALVRNATDKTAVGYAVMGLPGVAPDGYGAFSYGRALARGRTRAGSLR